MNQDETMPRQEPQTAPQATDPRMEEMRHEQHTGADEMATRDAQTAPERMEAERAQPQAGNGTGMSETELAGYRDRFMDLQARFIDDPQAATDQACSLVKEAVDRMMDSMRHDGDTEQMRMAMQRYRNVLETIADHTRA